MDLFLQILVAAICIFFAWRIFKSIKSQPEAFSKEKMGKSFYTVGLLTLFLIVAVTIMVMFVR
jgi:hypothetical protein